MAFGPGVFSMNSFSNSKDERLLAFYENVRHQVQLDMKLGSRHRLIGEGVKQCADRLHEAMDGDDCAKKGNVTLNGLRTVANRALSELSYRKSA
jgi:hypothetical protein